MEELVEVALPVYNGEKYIDLTLKSVINQTHKNFILTIYDNDSNDGTYEIVKKYFSDHRVKYKKNNINIGASRNFSKGLIESNSQYLMWIAADDYLEPTFIEKCLQKLIDNPKAAACTTNIKFIDKNNNLIRTYQSRDYSSNELKENIRQHVNGMGWYEFYALYRVEKIVDLEMKQIFGPDVLWTAEVLIRGPILNIDEYLLNYRLIPKTSEDYKENLLLAHVSDCQYTELYKNIYLIYRDIDDDMADFFVEHLLDSVDWFNIIYQELLKNLNYLINSKYLKSFFKSYLIEEINITEMAEKFSSKYHDFYNKGKEVYIWGAGGSGELAYHHYNKRDFNILGFIDSDLRKEGQFLCGLQIYLPKKIINNDSKPFIIVASDYYREIISVLKQFNYIYGEYYIYLKDS